MKNKYVLDTSFLSSFLNTSDVNHKQSLRLFMQLPEDFTLLIPVIVRLEMAVYKEKRDFYQQVSFKKLFSKLPTEKLEINDKFIEGFEKFVATTRFPLKATDYSVLFSCVTTNSELLTFDKKLSKYFKKISSQ